MLFAYVKKIYNEILNNYLAKFIIHNFKDIGAFNNWGKGNYPKVVLRFLERTKT